MLGQAGEGQLALGELDESVPPSPPLLAAGAEFDVQATCSVCVEIENKAVTNFCFRSPRAKFEWCQSGVVFVEIV